jgi:16S rRNA (uracil1498-N3)-methyltransferase
MHRCWFETETPPVAGDVVTLSPQESGHIVKALRMKPGNPLQLIAAERLYGAEITIAEEDGVQVRIVRELPSPEPAIRVSLVQGLPKGDKLEWIVQKATELGVYRIQPVEMERSIARITDKDEKKRERLSRIALEAAKQAGRAHVPRVLPAKRFADVLKDLRGSVYVAWEAEDMLRLSAAVAADRPEEITLVIGPEGGISAEEIAQLTTAGARAVTLGRRILRTETAGVCALALTMASLGEM